MMFDKKSLIEKDLVGHKTAAVYDVKFVNLFKEMPWAKWFADSNDPLNCRLAYLGMYRDYLKNMKLNTIDGLQRFSQQHLINGTTQTFDESYHRYANRRLRFYKGEYAYHRRIVRDWKFIEDEPIAENDYVIVSVPHCTTGDLPVGFYSMLDTCYDLKVPVIVDCAYIGTSVDVEFSVEHPAIESVSFSLTKGTGLGHVRSGVRYSNIDDDYPIAQQNRYDHTVLGAAKIGMYFIENLESPDFIPNIYRKHQLSVCAAVGLIPTKCMHIALGNSDWSDFNVDGYNRVGIRNLVKARKQDRI
jgi:hypothetical protein